MIAQQVGQSPAAQQMMGAIQAHLSEHLAFSYRKKIEEQMGVPLPPPDKPLPPEIEVQLSRLTAQAATQLMQINMAQAQQKQNEQMAQDPMMQAQQAELQIRKQEADTKAKKVDGDLALKAQELQLKTDETAKKIGESPEMLMQRHQQEMAQQTQQQQMAQQQHEQQIAQAQQMHDQKLGHTDQAAKLQQAIAIAKAKQAQGQQGPAQ
jgi:hypothetical protein